MSVGLWVFPENERAGKFYRSLGFEVEASSAKQFVLGGASLNEVHYVRRVGAGAFVWQESLAQLAKPVEPETSA